MTFWDTDTWHDYEELCGDEPGTRSRLLAESDWMTRVVELTASEAELWRGVRRSYKSIIHAAEREYVIQSVSGDCIYSAMKIHEQEAGRMTRPFETWTMMGDWVRTGNGLLIGGGIHRSEEITTVQDEWPRYAPVGLIDMRAYVYCTIYRAVAYYFSSACPAKNLSHALLWHAMKALKARGVRWLELGWQGEAKDRKGQQIEFYKSGWPGFNLPAKEAPELCGR